MKIPSNINAAVIQPGSFRDPSGFLFFQDGILYRQINKSYRNDYENLMRSGLYDELVKKDLLVGHSEVQSRMPVYGEAYKVIKPDFIDFISYPYEWSFSQLRDAALATLKIQKIAFNYGMVLKDATAYNIQFKGYKPCFIDTLSFEDYHEGDPWHAYSQFCKHFLGPLLLMNCVDIRLGMLLRNNIEGIPLELVSKLLPFRTKLKFSMLTHIHFHSKSQKFYSDKQVNIKKRKVCKTAFRGIIDSLEGMIKKLQWRPVGTEWADYYKSTNYDDTSFKHKKEVVTECVNMMNPTTIWDLGANVGLFSRLPALKNKYVISFDVDPAAVEKNYLITKKNNEHILPLLLDLTNPSPNIGWANTERESLTERGPADMVLALALIHHLAISNNVPFRKIAQFFHSICSSIVIEYIPKKDSQVLRLLSSRKDIFSDYSIHNFKSEFSKFFVINKEIPLKGSMRTIFLMTKKDRN